MMVHGHFFYLHDARRNINIKSRYLVQLRVNDDGEQVPFLEAVSEPHSLARMPHPNAPIPRITETVDKIPVKFRETSSTLLACPDNERLFKVAPYG